MLSTNCDFSFSIVHPSRAKKIKHLGTINAKLSEIFRKNPKNWLNMSKCKVSDILLNKDVKLTPAIDMLSSWRVG